MGSGSWIWHPYLESERIHHRNLWYGTLAIPSLVLMVLQSWQGHHEPDMEHLRSTSASCCMPRGDRNGETGPWTVPLQAITANI